MMNLLRQLFSPDGFMPHGMCYLWQPGILALHVTSDALITLAYFSIPFTLLYFVRKRTDLEFNWMFVCFAIFIVACGTTHLLEVWTIWHPAYWLSGMIKAITALASVPTAILLIRLVPDALRLPSPAALQMANVALARQVAERERAESEVRRINDELEGHVSQRTLQLEATNRTLLQEITERKRAEERLRTQFERLALLDRTTRAIADRRDLRNILEIVMRSLEDDLPVDFGCVLLHEPARSALTVSCLGEKSQSLAPALALSEHSQLDVDENGLARCLRGELVFEADLAQSAGPLARRLTQGGLGSLVMAPLAVESKVFGTVLAARRAARQFSSGDCEFLRQLSEHVALAMHQADLYGALQRAYEDLRQTQQTVMQQERLRALGQMASGIAHDINNALSPAALYAQSLLERDATLSSETKADLAIIQNAIEDVAHTVARMREFYRQREPQQLHTIVDINRSIERVVELTRARWNAMPQERGVFIKMQTELAPGLPGIAGSESEIRDALTNLILNAVDAMPEGGTLTVRSSTGPAGEVCVEVIDTGIGMDEATRSRCLEPFFTTKGERGTGLGLAMVYGMTDRHGAELQIDSEPGRGTTMRVLFPQSRPGVVGERTHSPPPRPAKPLHILFVDDDPIMLKSLQYILQQDGHNVTVADGGQRGIDAFRAASSEGHPFSVVITDLGMPHVDGRMVAQAVKSSAAHIPVILLTGWGHRLLADNDTPPYVDRVLSKPPKLVALRLALAELVRQEVAAPVPRYRS
ncbi:MAG TPA: ATP-binding protein [Steroidobacteraceae bacterium]|nr:ATP-binding protein [Steroidobacteraceae bacterium]